ncbi:MAG: hypothetical protein A3F54_05515 [Candidatus Kerfeldbacteria bacterium RIFCSPHIGHO2_12_FULL_48_17]|uniref:Uncharacterized protein n=1 Tax=Candidatus Kerfeldbacteria bacterium RIFCSPHIGHO2_12_FULL_48_17 TaxID=1798542 RepID=A0A1G2B6C6_9BACT|nr:MAG: hypothetical protein A3F54_05515 [Candidatus Kerfeldbacteria bacterium RIFCSPHIGHO2_12_FULL_48_17]
MEVYTWEFPETKEAERYGARNQTLSLILNLFPTAWTIAFADAVDQAATTASLNEFIILANEKITNLPTLRQCEYGAVLFPPGMDTWVQEGWRPKHVYDAEDKGFMVSIWSIIKHGQFWRVVIVAGDRCFGLKPTFIREVDKIDPEHRLKERTQPEDKHQDPSEAISELLADIAKRNLGIIGDITEAHAAAFLEEMSSLRGITAKQKALDLAKISGKSTKEDKSYWFIFFVTSDEGPPSKEMYGNFMMIVDGRDFLYDVAMGEAEKFAREKEMKGKVVIQNYKQSTKVTFESFRYYMEAERSILK